MSEKALPDGMYISRDGVVYKLNWPVFKLPDNVHVVKLETPVEVTMFTNYDRYHTMKETALAEELAWLADCRFCPVRSECPGEHDVNMGECIKRWLGWLRQEAEYAEITYDQ